MILKRRYCRKHGHDLNPDPGDFVLHCLRCGAMVDMHALLGAIDRCDQCAHPAHAGHPCSDASVLDGCGCRV